MSISSRGRTEPTARATETANVSSAACGSDPSRHRDLAWKRQRLRSTSFLTAFLVGLCVFTLGQTAQANNGSVALSYLVTEPIKIDGDLADWPNALPEHPIDRVLYGNTLRGEDDFSASFRTVYYADQATLFISVVVKDDAHCNRHNEGADHVILSLGKDHGESGVVGPNAVHYGLTTANRSDGVRSAMRIEAENRHYEFAFDLREFGPAFRPPPAAFTCSFTAEVWDIDDDGTQSYITWSPEVFKMLGAERHGDLIVGVDSQDLIHIRGRPITPSSSGRTVVRLRSHSAPSIIADVETDAFGHYDVALPSARYQRSIPRLTNVAAVNLNSESSRTLEDAIDYGPVTIKHLPLEYASEREWPAGELVAARPDELPRPRRLLFGREHGLRNAWIRELSQSRDGTIWMATENGLFAQDGVQLRSVKLPSGTAGRTVFATQADQGEEIWFGCENGIYVVRPSRNEINYLSYLAGHEILAIAKAHDGSILLGTNRGLFHCRQPGQGGTDYAFLPVKIPQSASTLSRNVHAFAVSSDETYTWVGTDSGLFRFNGKSLDREPMPTDLDHRVCELFVDSQDQLWIGTGCSLVCYTNGTFRTVHQQDQERLRYVRSIVELRGEILVAAYDGLLHIDPRDPLQVHRTESPVLLTGFVDRGQNFWFSKEEPGQLFCDVSDHEHHTIGNIHSLECREGMIWYTSKNPRGWFLRRYSIEDPSDSQRWRLPQRPTQIAATKEGPFIGTVAGLLKMENENLVSVADAVLGDQEVYDLKLDSADNLWVVCRGIGNVYQIVDGVVQRKANLLPVGSEQINWIVPELQGDLVAGTHQGLSFCREGDLVRRLSAADGYRGMLSHMAAAPDGTIWFSTTHGLYSTKDGSISQFKSPNELESVYRMALENGGSCWSTYRHGLGAVLENDPITFHTELDPAEIRDCVRAGSSIWYSTKHGLFRYQQQPRAAPTIVWHLHASRERTKQLKQEVEEGVKKQVALREQLRSAQRLESLGTLAAGISHDFNNTLQAISMTAELAMLEQESASVDDFLSEILLAARQAGDLTRSLLTFARKTTVTRQPTQIGDVLTDAVRIIRRTVPANIQFSHQVTDPDTWCHVDRSQIQQAIMNLCINARDAMPDGGTLTLDASRVVTDGTARVRIVVADTGHGISEEKLHRVFEPFFTEKPREKGTGLGLSITHGIVTAHEGTIAIHSVLNVGTEVEIHLPTCDEPSAHAAHAKPEVSGCGGLVLLADDQDTVRQGISELLRHHGFRVLSTQNGIQALTLARSNLHSLHAVILDVDMPGMDGIQVMRQLRADGYTRRIVIMTGLPTQVPPLDENTFLLEKPFTSLSAIAAVGEMAQTASPTIQHGEE